jgi:8-oxo-dGTP pyrophosphatase MutT (NUDIX family)
MELWDVYNSRRELTGRTHDRAAPLADGDFHLVARAWIVSGGGRVLLTKRSPNKKYPGLWETPSGSVLAGETSLRGAVREAFEESGVKLNEAEGVLVYSLTKAELHSHYDEWLFRKNVDLYDVRLQEGETCDAMFADFDEIEKMITEGTFVDEQNEIVIKIREACGK